MKEMQSEKCKAEGRPPTKNMKTNIMSKEGMVIAEFWELPVGARFNHGARRYEKIALNMARDDEDRCANVFHDITEVSWDRREGEARAEHRRPDAKAWWSRITPAVGQRRECAGKVGDSWKQRTVQSAKCRMKQ